MAAKENTHQTFILFFQCVIKAYDFISPNLQNVICSQRELKRYMKFGRTKFFEEMRRRARYVLGPTLGAALIVYVTYHALQGEERPYRVLAASRPGNACPTYS